MDMVGFPVHTESEVTMTYGGLFAFGFFSSPIAYGVVALLALLLFGNRLPSVMRSLGRSVVEFKKGTQGIEDEINDVVRSVDEGVRVKKEESEA
jgi:sec-independent protein translocase protein TatA